MKDKDTRILEEVYDNVNMQTRKNIHNYEVLLSSNYFKDAFLIIQLHEGASEDEIIDKAIQEISNSAYIETVKDMG